MIYFMLYDLRDPAGIRLSLLFEIDILILHFNFLIPHAFFSPLPEKDTLSSVSYAPDFLMIFGLYIKTFINPMCTAMIFFSYPDHIRRHTNTLFFMCLQSIQQIHPCLPVRTQLPARMLVQKKDIRSNEKIAKHADWQIHL